jgi:hypothetical protein
MNTEGATGGVSTARALRTAGLIQATANTEEEIAWHCFDRQQQSAKSLLAPRFQTAAEHGGRLHWQCCLGHDTR